VSVARLFRSRGQHRRRYAAGQPGRCRSSTGFTVVELVVACLLGALALMAAWSWLFTSSSAAARQARRLEAETSLAFVLRLSSAELRRAAMLLSAPSPGCTSSSVVFATATSDGSNETVSYVWNPTSGVLWRKAVGSHLASGVTAFTVEYLDAGGVAVGSAGSALSQTDLARVRRLRLSLTIACGDGELRASWDVTPRVVG
jgi:type II secretory pathway component PulJ